MVGLQIDIPENFLCEETRCDYVVTSEMKRVWAVELDLANALLTVCKAHNLKIYAFAGTELGTIRHKGFVPWDDDIDFTMPRKDYDELCSIGDTCFSEPYFLQTEYNDKGSLRGHAQLRNSLTTGIIRRNFERGYEFNQGIFIDIFPVDNIPDDPELFKKQIKLIKTKKYLMHCVASLNSRYSKAYRQSVFKKVAKAILHKPISVLDEKIDLERIIYRSFESDCCKYSNIETKMCGILSYNPELSRSHWNCIDSAEIAWMPFEFLMFPIAIGYKNKLERAYGDYMIPKRSPNLHGDVFFDVDVPYTEYLRSGELVKKKCQN